jgi:hypothetical protein
LIEDVLPFVNPAVSGQTLGVRAADADRVRVDER